MIRQLLNKSTLALFFINSALWAAGSGPLFKVTTSGASLSQTVSYTLCLNIYGQHPLSCQNYATQKVSLSIKTTIPNHTYTTAGIKINTPGYAYTGQTFALSPMNRGIIADGYQPIGPISTSQAAAGSLSSEDTKALPAAAVGFYKNNIGGLVPLSYTSTNGGVSWALSETLPLPKDVSTTVPESTLFSVSCDRSGLICTTVGAYYTNTSGTGTLIYTSTNGGGTWSLIDTPGVNDGFILLTSVSCSNSGLICVAVGTYRNNDNVSFPISYATTDGWVTWKNDDTFPLPGTESTTLIGVSCSSSGQNCTAVGIYGPDSNQIPISYRTTNGGVTWLLNNNPPVPEDSKPIKDVPVLLGVSCGSTGQTCSAVGFYNNTDDILMPLSYTSTDGGVTWEFSETLPLSGNKNTALWGVSCSSSGQNCTAVGVYGPDSNQIPISYRTTNGGVDWTLSEVLPLPHDNSITDPSDVLTVVACDSTGLFCYAVGFYVNTAEGVAPLSYTSTNGGTTWTVSTSSLPEPSDVESDPAERESVLGFIERDK